MLITNINLTMNRKKDGGVGDSDDLWCADLFTPDGGVKFIKKTVVESDIDVCKTGAIEGTVSAVKKSTDVDDVTGVKKGGSDVKKGAGGGNVTDVKKSVGAVGVKVRKNKQSVSGSGAIGGPKKHRIVKEKTGKGMTKRNYPKLNV